MKARLGVLLLLVGLLVGAPVALGGSSRVASNSKTFSDSVGEDPRAPDITSIAVSNDDAGLITFQVNISNRPTLTPDMFLVMFLDTDQKPTTGATDFAGAEYAVDLEPGSVTLFKWDGSNFVLAPSQTSLTYAYSSGATIRVSSADLGKTKGINFWVVAASGVTFDASGNPVNDPNLPRDWAPDQEHGTYAYQVLTKLVLSVTAFTTSPKPAKAGRPFSVSLAATENDTAGPVQSGTVACAATLGGKRVVALRHLVANGVASCAWRTPATAKGQTIRGTITLIVQGTRITRPFAARLT